MRKPRWLLGIFDKDGTLVDSSAVIHGAVCEIFKIFAPNLTLPTLQEYREKFSILNLPCLYDYGVPRCVTLNELAGAYLGYLKEHEGEITAFGGAAELLFLCKRAGMNVAVVSASPENLNEEFSRLGLIPFIDNLIGNTVCRENALVETLDLFGVRSEDAFYCDDTYDGLMCAKKCNICTIGVTHGLNSASRVRKARPDFLADSLFEVARIVKNGGAA